MKEILLNFNVTQETEMFVQSDCPGEGSSERDCCR